MRLFHRKRPYKIKVIYKSGREVTFRCSEFQIRGGTYTWADAKPWPLKIGADDISAVYHLNH